MEDLAIVLTGLNRKRQTSLQRTAAPVKVNTLYKKMLETANPALIIDLFNVRGYLKVGEPVNTVCSIAVLSPSLCQQVAWISS